MDMGFLRIKIGKRRIVSDREASFTPQKWDVELLSESIERCENKKIIRFLYSIRDKKSLRL